MMFLQNEISSFRGKMSQPVQTVNNETEFFVQY